ncbi:Glycerate 2-kinase [Desulfamplus magnetovallimortis]|uniref:Glycerate 2-kinase n=1 Tax=Desulfamplus magnetovallimortis TaxID=1246637 RepID=A0A1W1HFI7_9BACT|nr:glycerate kinase [Desulfamplus magnetovallimortis]SLM31249.1 Glycerate 2-kinase [Desulfamplus magnetovallimortis]
MEYSYESMKKAALKIFYKGVAAVSPEICVRKNLALKNGSIKIGKSSFSLEETGKIYLVGVGKASAAMAGEAEATLADHIDDGLVITKYGHSVPLKKCRLMEAGHPIPDENGVKATCELLSLISCAGPGDLVICMISGGGSALTPAPVEGISLADKQETTRHLLACGATIHEINTVRKHLSLIKGGQFCKNVNGANVVSLILSDVIGDDLDIIASGMTVGDGSTFNDCRDTLLHYRLWEKIPIAVRQHIESGISGTIRETPKPGDALFANVHNYISGTLSHALSAAEEESVKSGFNTLVLSSMIQGEATEVAKVLCAIAKETELWDRPLKRPACLLSGGETTVTLKGTGKGGRNMELALAAAINLQDSKKIVILSAGTDGTDGPTDAAGAFADSSTVKHAKKIGLSLESYLADNNSYIFFKELGDLVVTGPTMTNVMDMQIVIICD